MPVAAPSVIRPAFLWTPPSAVGNLGDEMAELAIQLGQQVDEEERIALGALSPVQANGMPAGLEAGIVCGRRQIKSWALEMSTIHDAFVTKVHRVVWTAHLTETSDDNFDHITSLIESYDWLRKRVRRIYRGNGDHRIMLMDGGRVEFTAREAGKTGRGRDVNRLVLDEWLFGTPGMLGAMVPMLGGVSDRYIRYGSSPGLLKSESLRQLRDRGRRGGDPSLSWCEWTSERLDEHGKRVVPECASPECLHQPGMSVGCFLDDHDIRRGVNPAYGRRLSREFVDQERLAMPPMEYMRERCGVWEDPPDADVADSLLSGWPERLTGDVPTDPLTLGLDVSADGRSAALVVCGGGVLEVVDYRPGKGTSWVPKRIEVLKAKHKITAVGLLRSGPARALMDQIPDVVLLNSIEESIASIGMVADINDDAIHHRGQQVLDQAVESAKRQLSGDGWRWSRKISEPADISALLAAVVARHLSATADSTDRSTDALLTSFG